jgi:hypothetical protein
MRPKATTPRAGHDEVLEGMCVTAVLDQAVEDFLTSPRGKALLAGAIAKCVARCVAPVAAAKLLADVLTEALAPAPPPRRPRSPIIPTR